MRRIAALLTLCLLASLIGGTGLWLCTQQRQYALNRALIDALVNGDEKQALTLVDEGADPNTHYKPTSTQTLFQLVAQMLHRSPSLPNDSPTALSIACGAEWYDENSAIWKSLEDHPEIPRLVQIMLEHGANVNTHADDCTPLLWASFEHRLNTSQLLLEHGADVNAHVGEDGWTPLMAAAMNQDTPNLVRLLLEHGANVNTQDTDGNTALLLALEGGSIKVFRQLLTHRANPNLANNLELTPLKLAKQQGQNDIIALLKRYGARR